jgi:hypothetical protein
VITAGSEVSVVVGVAASAASSSATPFWCGSGSFVIDSSGRSKRRGVGSGGWLSEIIQSERWSRSVGVEIHSQRATSPLAAPRDFNETELALRIAPVSPEFR